MSGGYKKKLEADLNTLIQTGIDLLKTLQAKGESQHHVAQRYQAFYSESCRLIRAILPERLDEFEGFYRRVKLAKVLDITNYTISDFFLGVAVTLHGKAMFDNKRTALSKFHQQVLILVSAQKCFSSSIFNIRELIRADLLDSEIEVSRELLKSGFTRASGAVAGVSLERHLGHVCENRQINLRKKDPTLADYNEALKGADAYDIPEWRGIQRLADLRNKCVHDKRSEPTPEEIKELIDGVEKRLKTIY